MFQINLFCVALLFLLLFFADNAMWYIEYKILIFVREMVYYDYNTVLTNAIKRGVPNNCCY